MERQGPDCEEYNWLATLGIGDPVSLSLEVRDGLEWQSVENWTGVVVPNPPPYQPIDGYLNIMPDEPRGEGSFANAHPRLITLQPQWHVLHSGKKIQLRMQVERTGKPSQA